MFQKLLFKVTSILGKLYGRFNRAYNETYSDKKTGQEANKEIDARKELNKMRFICDVAWLTALHAYSKDNIKLDFEKTMAYAEYVFNREKEKGNIDELNRMKGESDE